MDFLEIRLLGPPKWREPHKSLKFVDFIESAPFPEAISKAPVDFREGRCAQILSGRQQHEPRINPGGATKSSKFGDSLEGCAHPKGQID